MKEQMNTGAFKAYWGAGNLTRWDHVALRDVRISSSAKRFLTDVGLPTPGRDICGWSLEWDRTLKRLDYNDRDLRLLGSNGGFNLILIDETRGGCIVWDATEDRYERYVNNSVEQFAASLIEMDKFTEHARRIIDRPFDVADAARRVTALQKRLKKIDETAIADRESLWSADIYTMRLDLR